MVERCAFVQSWGIQHGKSASLRFISVEPGLNRHGFRNLSQLYTSLRVRVPQEERSGRERKSD